MNYWLWNTFGPQSWSVWLLGFAVVCFLFRGPNAARRGRWLVFASFATALLLGASPLASWLLRPLEQRFPATRLDHPPASIVVLAGAEALANAEWRGALEVNGAGERLIEGAALARRFPSARLAIAGGVRLKDSSITDVALAADAWKRLGVPTSQIEVIGDTPDTCANAIGARRLPKPVLLVTSAAHMPRAVACFRAAGIEPWVYPVDFNATRPGRPIGSYLSTLDHADFALHEWVGLAWYRLRGRTSELLPSPR